MVSKNNRKLIADKNRQNEKQRFALRKLNVGVASILLGVTFSIYGGGQLVAHADTTGADNQADGAQTTNEGGSLTSGNQVTLGATSGASDTSASAAANSSAAADQANSQGTSHAASAANSSASDQAATPASADNTIMPLAAPAPNAEDTNAVTVSDAQGLIDAISNGTASVIKVDADIKFPSRTSPLNNQKVNVRDITIQSADPNQRHSIDFGYYSFLMNDATHGVTFKDIDLYGQNYFGAFENAGYYNFENVNYTGSQLIYTDNRIVGTKVTFTGKDNIKSVYTYVSPTDQKTYTTQPQGGPGNQQVLQFGNGTNSVTFAENSEVEFSTYNSDVIEVDNGSTTIDVKKGAKLTLNPHSKNSPEQYGGILNEGIARAIAVKGNLNLNVDRDADLDINLVKSSDDTNLSGALYVYNGKSNINVNGQMNINVDGQPKYDKHGYNDPIWIEGDTPINVNGGSVKVNVKNYGDYQGSIITLAGKATVDIEHHGTFEVTGDGTKATALSLGANSTFKASQPASFKIDMPDGATAVKNGTIQFTGVKTSENGKPIGEINVSYDASGNVTVNKVTSADKQTVIDAKSSISSAKNKVNLYAAGKEVNLQDVTFTKDADGNYVMSGNANTADLQGAYVYISVNGTVKQVGSQTIWTITNSSDVPTSSPDSYTAQTSTDGKFTYNLGKLNDSDTVSVYAAKDFVSSDTQTKTVSEWMNDSVRSELQQLVDEASNVEADTNTNFTDADQDKKDAYTSAIASGKSTLDKQSPAATTDELQTAIKQINDAKSALNGDAKLADAKENLQSAVDAATDVKKTAAYFNGSSDKTTAYDDAVSAGANLLDTTKTPNPTLTQLTDALADINTAKGSLNGQATKTSDLQTAVSDATMVENEVNYKEADSAKQTAYTDAINAAKNVLDSSKTPNPTQKQVNDALQAINYAKDGLNGDAKHLATTKQTLQDLVAAAPAERKTGSYLNADQTKQTAYDNAITAGQDVLNQANPSQSAIDNAISAINTAKDNLDGTATDKSALQTEVNKATTVETSNNFMNADQSNKDAYTKAISDAETVLNDSQATQQAVNDALTAITKAKSNLNGDAKTAAANRTELQQLVAEAPKVESGHGFYNASEQDQTNYTDAITAGQGVLDDSAASADQVKTALDNIKTAKAKLTGEETNKTALQSDIDNVNTVKAGSNYTNASAIQKTKYDDAITAGQALLTKANATQAEVDNAVQAITTAQNGLNGDQNLTTAKSTAKSAIDQALQDKTTAINNAQNLTSAERTDLVNKATKAAINAKSAIDNATTPADVTTAQQQGIDNINAVTIPSLADAKQKAEKAVDDALTTKKTAINGATSLTDTDKQSLIDQATAAANTAKANINNATTNDAAAKAGQDGVYAINQITVPASSNAKTQAKQDLADAATAAKNKIDQNTNLSDTDRQTAKGQVDQDNTAAQGKVDNATTDSAVNKAVNDGKLAIAKDVANAAIDNAAAGKKSTISNTSLTDEEKAAVNTEVDNAAAAAKSAISSATTEEDVASEQTAGVKSINDITVPSSSAAKKAAEEAIDQAVAAKKKAIQDSSLVAEEKTELNGEVDTAATAAKNAIEAATTNAAVTSAKTAGVNSINGIKVPNSSDAKNAAKKAIDATATAKKDDIQASSLTDEEKAKLNGDVDAAVQTAKDAIEAASTKDGVTSAQTAGETAINNVNVPTSSAAKDAAKTAIDNVAAAKKTAIQASQLTNEEKSALNTDVDNAVKNAKDAIDAATTNSDVTAAQTAGEEAINNINVPSSSTAKDNAKQSLTDAATAAKNKIDQDTNLTNAEKQAVKDQIDQDAQTAQGKINQAASDNDLNKAVNDGKLALAKDVANAAIDNAAAGKKSEIAASSLTDQEKAKLNTDVDNAAQTAKTAIANATTEDGVTTAQIDGVNAISQIKVPSSSKAKEQAKSGIDDAAQSAKSAIDQDANLTANEKQAAKDQVDQDAQAAKGNIDQAKTDDAVAKAADAGKLALAKDAANAAIDNAAAGKKSAINGSSLTTEEKAKLNTDVANAAQSAKTAINNATTENGVTTAQNNGIAAINNIKVPTSSAAKDQAKQDLTDAVKNAKNQVDQDTNLTNGAKQAAKDQIDQDAQTAQGKINQAATDNDLNKAVNDGKLALAKDVANAAIDNAAAGKKSEIAGASLTDQEKAKLDTDVDNAAQTAKTAIANATTEGEVTTAQNNGVEAINNIAVPTTSTAKDQAKQDLTTAAKDAKDQIDQDTNLTNNEKQAAKDQIDQDAQTAQGKIDQATTDDDINQAAEAGKLALAKDVANTAIDNAVAGKLKEIQSPLTTEEQAAEAAKVKNAGDEAKAGVNAATTVAEVQAAQKAGVKKVNDLTIPTSSAAKTAAKAAIDNAAAAKKSEIAASSLTAEEKAQLDANVDNAVASAKSAIDNATTTSAVTTAQNDGIAVINQIAVPASSATKDAAKTAIDQAAASKKGTIQASSLTTEEKAKLDTDVDNAAQTAKSAIDSATTANKVTAARDAGIAAINQIAVPANSAAKEQAKADLTTAVKDAKDQIDQDTNLTDSEKQAAKDQIDRNAQTAQGKINQAATDNDLNKAVNDGKLALAKDVANAAIDNAAAGKKGEITSSSLTDQEKAKLNQEVADAVQKAKDAISAATTTSEVTTAQNDGIDRINQITVQGTSAVKEQAKSTIDDAVKDAKAAIDQDTNLTAGDRQAAKAQIDKDAQTAKNAIDQATTDTAVAQADQAGRLQIAKEVADAAIDNAVAGKLKEVQSPLTTEEQAAEAAKVKNAGDEAKTKVAAATTVDEVKTAQEDGIKQVSEIAIPTSSAVKDAAKTAINQAGQSKIAEINASQLTDQAKTDLINTVRGIVAGADQNIDAATTDPEVANAKNVGLAAIAGVEVATNSGDHGSEQPATNPSDHNGQETSQETVAGQNTGTANSLPAANGQATSNSTKQLPQTGSQQSDQLAAFGLAAIAMTGLFGLAKRGRKEE